MKETTERAGPFGTMSQEPWHPGKGANSDRVIQLNWEEGGGGGGQGGGGEGGGGGGGGGGGVSAYLCMF